ncbi:MAG: EVE domain-containing protein [Clostridium sp.]|nr:EVE domain-containing protein [Clostridium sp.]
MKEIIKLREEKGRFTCDIPLTMNQWQDILNDNGIVGQERMHALLSFYYMQNHQATCKQCAEKYGQNINTYNSAISSFGKAVIKKIGTFRIEDAGGNERFWPVAVKEGRYVKGDDGMFQWTLRPELVEALRKFIINDALAKYTADFAPEWKREEYKWKALKTFHDNWDMEAPDFAGMLSRAFARHGNLLDSSYAFPKGALVEMAQSKPKILRGMFCNLYDETLPFESRIADFISMADKEFFFGEGKKHFQSTNAVSVYLWSRYPGKYYIYKWGEYSKVAEKIGLDNVPKATGLPEEVTKGYDMYSMLQEAVAMNMELLAIYNHELDGNPDKYFKPDGLATLISDFGFWISRYYTTLISTHLPKVWVYAPGEGAKMWDECKFNGIISIGWEKVGDLSGIGSREEMDKAVDDAYPDEKVSMANSKLCLWEFCHVMDDGDIVYAKQGTGRIIGRGVIESGYTFDASRKHYPHIRKVKWTHIGEWNIKTVLGGQLPQKTLTDMSRNRQWQKSIDEVIMGGGNGRVVVSEPETSYGDIRYWWLVASPRYWSFADLKVGGTIEYTVKNDKGNRRRVPINFEQAKEGDIVIGYEANPVKKIVALAKVVKASDGETISYGKTEELENPVSWLDFKDLPELREMEFIRNKNGSFFKLTNNEYEVLLNLIRQENPEPENNPIRKPSDVEPYSREQFLDEVFMTSEEYENLTALLRLKKNVILQGAPGVGKTFSAKRIACSMMGEMDESRIEMVQFHQNFSYEDFIMGFRPTGNGGFELRDGVFYSFCKRAELNPHEDYFFIIDEINRGNLSKIFGELLMLIEKDYRGRQIRLAYRNELFSVPENLYIIGMMNTADRSLAMIDYVLRRRFSFYPMRPGFDTDGFKKEMAGHSDPRVEKIVNAVMQLNDRIANDDSLGNGFCIGHSYFCGQPEDVPWIEQVVNYDICPMLDEYWFDSREKCQEEKKKLRELLK